MKAKNTKNLPSHPKFLKKYLIQKIKIKDYDCKTFFNFFLIYFMRTRLYLWMRYMLYDHTQLLHYAHSIGILWQGLLLLIFVDHFN